MRINQFMRRTILIVFAVFSAGILALSIGLYAANGLSSRELLAESIESQLMTVATSAESRVSGDVMEKYTSFGYYFDGYTGNPDDYYKTVDDEKVFAGSDSFTDEYQGILTTLRELRDTAQVDYVYAVMKVGDVYRLVYDTDEEDEEPFCDYDDFEDIDIFVGAMGGTPGAGVMNVTDEWGSYNSAAMPVKNSSGKVVGIICADILDTLYSQEIVQFTTGIITLVVVLTAVLLLFGAALVYLLNHIKRIQDNLNKMAHYDKLTDLPNRRFLLEQLAEMTVKKPSEPFALLFVDLDNFKKVNDNAGHDAGDELLRHIATYLQGAHQNSEVFRMSAGAVNVTARVGGDEFIMIAPGIDKEEDAGAFAQELLDGFAREHIDKYIEKYEVGLSIGVALYPGHISNFHTLINYADTAMYHAKKAGKNRYCIYTDEMNKKTDGADGK